MRIASETPPRVRDADRTSINCVEWYFFSLVAEVFVYFAAYNSRYCVLLR